MIIIALPFYKNICCNKNKIMNWIISYPISLFAMGQARNLFVTEMNKWNVRCDVVLERRQFWKIRSHKFRDMYGSLSWIWSRTRINPNRTDFETNPSPNASMNQRAAKIMWTGLDHWIAKEAGDEYCSWVLDSLFLVG